MDRSGMATKLGRLSENQYRDGGAAASFGKLDAAIGDGECAEAIFLGRAQLFFGDARR